MFEQGDLFAAAPDTAVLEPPPEPGPRPAHPAPTQTPPAHTPGPWAPAAIGYGLEVATCLRCATQLYRPAGVQDAQLLRRAAYRGGLTPAGVCRPVPRAYWGPRPGRQSSTWAAGGHSTRKGDAP